MVGRLRNMSSTLGLMLFLFVRLCLAQKSEPNDTITTESGLKIQVPRDRMPSLYTVNFGSCMDDGAIDITRFEAAFYKDNMTVVFHFGGDSILVNESVIMYIQVFAYGESRLVEDFVACDANFQTLCPVEADVPIEASGYIPMTKADFNIPKLAYTIPDFEGQATLRFFSRSTQTEVGCFSAVVTNGASFSQPYAIAPILGIFSVVAIAASFATSIYADRAQREHHNQIAVDVQNRSEIQSGDLRQNIDDIHTRDDLQNGEPIRTMRKHYARSLSVLVVFAVYHHIFFSGALELNFPSVLVAFWSNYAWSAGMVHTRNMQASVSSFAGASKGKATAVRDALTGHPAKDIQRDFDVSQISGRTRGMPSGGRSALGLNVDSVLSKRGPPNSNGRFGFYGKSVQPGIPLPGTYNGFAGTLAQINIPASNAFITGFAWFIILVVSTTGCVFAFRGFIEVLCRTNLIRKDRLQFFRTHWLGYTGLALLRSLVIAFPMLMFLAIFELSYRGTAGALTIAAFVFVLLFVGMFGSAGYACYGRVKAREYLLQPERVHVEKVEAFPWFRFNRATKSNDKLVVAGFPFWWFGACETETSNSVHDDVNYTMKFGWLASRFRRTRWWFFATWLVYEFIRACFLGGASKSPRTQVVGLLVVEIIAFIICIILRPYEDQWLNAIMIYCLGFSKITTLGLSIAFDPSLKLARIPVTIVGIVIIIIQGTLTVLLLVAIIAGAIDACIALTRNREFSGPGTWVSLREKYFARLEAAEKVLADPPPVIPSPSPRSPYFAVKGVRRELKFSEEIEDDADSEETSGSNRNSIISTNSAYARDTTLADSRVPSRAGSNRSSRRFSRNLEPANQGSLNLSLKSLEGMERAPLSSLRRSEDRISQVQDSNDAIRPVSRATRHSGSCDSIYEADEPINQPGTATEGYRPPPKDAQTTSDNTGETESEARYYQRQEVRRSLSAEYLPKRSSPSIDSDRLSLSETEAVHKTAPSTH